jgi:hypothetical protein
MNGRYGTWGTTATATATPSALPTSPPSLSPLGPTVTATPILPNRLLDPGFYNPPTLGPAPSYPMPILPSPPGTLPGYMPGGTLSPLPSSTTANGYVPETIPAEWSSYEFGPSGGQAQVDPARVEAMRRMGRRERGTGLWKLAAGGLLLALVGGGAYWLWNRRGRGRGRALLGGAA